MKHYPPNGEPTTTNQHCQPLITNPKPTNCQTPNQNRLQATDVTFAQEFTPCDRSPFSVRVLFVGIAWGFGQVSIRKGANGGLHFHF